MKSRRSLFPTLLILLSSILLAGAERSVEPAEAGGELELESSANFEIVDSHLRRGGLVYAYIDIEGDVRRVAERLSGFLDMLRASSPEMEMVPPVSILAIAEATGLDAVQAVGLSSSRSAGTYHNRAFFLVPGGPRGLLQTMGTENRPFHFARMAPAGTDFVYEVEINGGAVVDFVRAIARQIDPSGDPNGPAGMVETYLNQPVPKTSLTANTIIEATSGRLTAIGEVDATETFPLPTGGEIQKLHALVRLENGHPLAADIWNLFEVQPEFLEGPDEAGWSRIVGFLGDEMPFMNPVIASNHETGELILATSPEYLDRCLNLAGESVTEDAHFRQATRGLPAAGTSFSYVTPGLSDYIADGVRQGLAATGDANAEVASDWILKNLIFSEPIASVISIEPDGILAASNWHYSHKTNLTSIASANPVTIGLLAAMAIPAFSRVREQSQETAILNNLRMLRSAADQYFLEEGKDRVETSELIGPDRYIRQFSPVAGETYPEVIALDDDELTATLPDGREVRYSPYRY